MIVIADTSPLNYLVRLGHADILQRLYQRVLVPKAVLTELRHPAAPPEVLAWADQPPTWIEAVQVRQVDFTLILELGAGEREAISLALELHADVLLIDERAGRQEAEARQIEVAGTLAVLLQASLRGYFEFPATLQRLRQLGFRVSRQVETVMLARYEEVEKSRSKRKRTNRPIPH